MNYLARVSIRWLPLFGRRARRASLPRTDQHQCVTGGEVKSG